ncbi:MAG: hypothetical protein ACRDC4_06835, partial [Plesiomonas sp.]
CDRSIFQFQTICKSTVELGIVYETISAGPEGLNSHGKRLGYICNLGSLREGTSVAFVFIEKNAMGISHSSRILKYNFYPLKIGIIKKRSVAAPSFEAF